MKWLWLPLFLLASLGFAQTAKYVTLTPTDAQQAKALDDKVDAAMKERADFQKQITKRYTIEDHCDRSNCYTYHEPITIGVFGPFTVNGSVQDDHKPKEKTLYYKNGFDQGWQYTEDYKLIVPVPVPVKPSNVQSYNGSCITVGELQYPNLFDVQKLTPDATASRSFYQGYNYYGDPNKIFWYYATGLHGGNPINFEPGDIDWLANDIGRVTVTTGILNVGSGNPVHKEITLKRRTN